MLAGFSDPAIWRKDGSSPMKKCHFLVSMDFTVKEVTNLASTFT
jgi:hypothetical protein